MKNDVPHSLRAKKKVGGRTRRQSRAKLRSKVPLISVLLSNKSCYCYLSPLKELSYTDFSGLLPGRSHDNIKNRWNVLKTIFHREVKRSVELADAAYTSQSKYVKSLMFIKGSDYVDSSVSTLDPKEKL